MKQIKGNLFEQAITHYEVLAEKHFSCSKDVRGASKDVRRERGEKLRLAKQHLDNQLSVLRCMASVQAQLDEYREAGRMATLGGRSERLKVRKVLHAEAHHPTKILVKFMLISNKPKPSPDHAAHHIVPGKGKTKFAYLARTHMLTLGVRINDPDNGVWLPKFKRHTPHWSMPEAKAHLQYHTEEYEYLVNRKLEVKYSEYSLRAELNLIGRLLQNNRFSGMND